MVWKMVKGGLEEGGSDAKEKRKGLIIPEDAGNGNSAHLKPRCFFKGRSVPFTSPTLSLLPRKSSLKRKKRT